MVLCRGEARMYAVCVTSKGLAVEQGECQKQFASLMKCLGRTPKK